MLYVHALGLIGWNINMLHVYSQDSILYEDKRFKTTNIPQSLRHCALLFGIEAKRNVIQYKVSAKIP